MGFKLGESKKKKKKKKSSQAVTLAVLVGAFPAIQAAAIPTPAASSTLPTGTSVVSGLNVLAKAAGKLYFGSATDNPELNDTTYTSYLDNSNHFGQITPGNALKWDATEPEPNTFTFTEGDQVTDLVKSNGQILRAHNLVWHEQLPSWVTSNNYSASQLTEVIQNHISNLAGHYKGQPNTDFGFRQDAWDVVNEPFNDDGSFRSDVFYDTLGSSYISIALDAAREADPNAKLYINDYNIEYTGAKATAMQNLVKTLQSDSVPIDGIGMESHFIVGEVPTTLVENFQAFADLGVEFAITELDIRMTLPETADLLEQQKQDYYTVVSACLQVSACKGITVWDWTDKYSWIPSTFPGQGAATPFDDNYEEKPAFDGIVAALQGQSL
ncbi:endo-1,4-B-xylanase [Rhodofomes roseus]|uniref:Beta-xylanase n=1 Tax=Rhodofomes roseus TaxID=34475 RepID=A0ABQ8K1Z7_9APHY|nr:endo-1,4-B-xylanase [Rhodofomes roseus]KAH9830738.1 endo-1,4-B-xylanase [Rhodofomes roseus]